MTSKEYAKLVSEVPNVELVRPHWNGEEYHRERMGDVTVLICQRKTYDNIRLCLESLLSHYPDIPVLVVDGDSMDRSSEYLAIKSKIYGNVKVWTRNGINSHGLTMDEAIREKISTKYVLLMDSDVVTLRGGWLEVMMSQMKEGVYASGSLMLVSRKNQGCGIPLDLGDILRYAHPSCSIIDRDVYLTFLPFVDHGAPCWQNMDEAESKGYGIEYFPVDKYVAHLSGGSWTSPRTVWADDMGVSIRPFVTFVVKWEIPFMSQDDTDFDIVFVSEPKKQEVVIHGMEPVIVENGIFGIRFGVIGEFVCEVNKNIGKNFVSEAKKKFIESPYEEIEIDGHKLIKRQKWQRENALK